MHIYHYVYRITNIVKNKHYYGKRSSNIEPKLDLGIKYFSSSRVKDFIEDQKINPNNYKYKIIKVFNNSKHAHKFESKIHIRLKVDRNPNFYNLVCAPENSNFDPKNMIFVKDKNGNKSYVKRNDPDLKSGKLKAFNYGYTIVKDKKGNRFAVLKNDPRYISGELIHMNTGSKGSLNQKYAASKASKDTIPVIDLYGNKFRIKSNDKRIGTILRHPGTTDVLYLLETGERKWLPKYTEEKIKEIIHQNKCHITKNSYDFYVPWGLFESSVEAHKHVPKSYNLSEQNVKIYCRNNSIIITKRNYKFIENNFSPNVIGKTFGEIGFNRRNKFIIPT